MYKAKLFLCVIEDQLHLITKNRTLRQAQNLRHSPNNYKIDFRKLCEYLPGKTISWTISKWSAKEVCVQLIFYIFNLISPIWGYQRKAPRTKIDYFINPTIPRNKGRISKIIRNCINQQIIADA